MALPARRIPKSVAHLDIEIVAAALIRHDANVRNAARALGVPSGDLRKLVLVDQRLADAALEAVESRLDDAEANLCEALHCGDPRRRDAISMFMLRNTQRASKRGYAVAASAASLEVGQRGRRAKPSSSGGAATIARWMSSSATGKLFVFRAMTARGVTTTLRASCRCRRRCSSMPLRLSPSPSTSRLFLIQLAAGTRPRRPLRARADRRLDSQSPHRLSARLLSALSYADRHGGGLGGSFERRGEGAFSSGLSRAMAY